METKEVKIQVPKGCEIDKENSTLECIKFKRKNEINTWKDIKDVKGYYIDFGSSIAKIDSNRVENQNKNIFISKKYAKAALALAQISQLMPYYDGEITNEEWLDKKIPKFTLVEWDGEIVEHVSYMRKEFISFHTKEQMEKFMSFPENVQLVKDYYMID